MKAIIIYDDFAFAALANTRLQDAGLRSDLNVNWSIKPWRLNTLKDPAARGMALTDAVDAHLIVLAGQRAESLQSWLREWLTRWANARQIPDAALAVIGNPKGGLSKPATPELSQFVRQHGLTFIIDEGPVAKSAVKLFIRHSRERKFPALVTRSRSTETAPRVSNRRWGING